MFVNRLWNDYKDGFGNASSDYWVGLKHMHAMTARSHKYLVVRLFFRSNSSSTPILSSAAYKRFAVKNESYSYRLKIADYDVENSALCEYNVVFMLLMVNHRCPNGFGDKLPELRVGYV